MSLRARVLAGMAVVAFVLVFGAFVIARTTKSYLIDRVDAQLDDAAVPRDAFGAFADRFLDPDGTTRVQPAILNALYVGRVDGHTVTTIALPNTGGGVGRPKLSAARAVAAAKAAHPANFSVASTVGASGYRVRVVRTFDGGTVVLGLSLHDVDASLRRLLIVEAIATASVIGIVGLVLFWVLRLGVRPIKRMTAAATAIASGDLSQRVPVGQVGTEAGELSDALNVMLARIEDAFAQRAASEARLRQFVADASHELRTPLTTIRGYVELYRHGGLADDDDLAQAMRRTEQETVRMASLVDDLLLLARLDEGRPLEHGSVDLTVLCVDAVADAQVAAPDRCIEADVGAPVTVSGDEHRLRQVVANLLTNALVHTPTGTPVVVRVQRIDARGVVEVHDDGPGMTPDSAAHAFERFWRADESRSRGVGGAGLGLAIVDAIVQAHGGSVSLVSAEGRGTTVRFELPLAPSDGSSGATALPDREHAAAAG